jgi:REP element-mobilizing transposase RayT
MGKKWSNENLPGALHYLTGNVINRIPIFKSEACCKGFFEVLRDLLQSWPSKIIAYVVMPDHFHLILNPRDGNIQGFGAALKSLGAKKIIEITGGERFLLDKPDKDGSIHQVWQESFKAFPLWSSWMSSQKINYIHANPVKAKLVASAKDYIWSSFRAFYFDSKEPLPVDHDWWWPDDAEKLSKAQKELGWKTYRHRVKGK